MCLPLIDATVHHIIRNNFCCLVLKMFSKGTLVRKFLSSKLKKYGFSKEECCTFWRSLWRVLPSLLVLHPLKRAKSIRTTIRLKHSKTYYIKQSDASIKQIHSTIVPAHFIGMFHNVSVHCQGILRPWKARRFLSTTMYYCISRRVILVSTTPHVQNYTTLFSPSKAKTNLRPGMQNVMLAYSPLMRHYMTSYNVICYWRNPPCLRNVSLFSMDHCKKQKIMLHYMCFNVSYCFKGILHRLRERSY